MNKKIILIIMIGILQGLDLLTTEIALSFGYIEGNPFYNIYLFLGIKVGIIIFAIKFRKDFPSLVFVIIICVLLIVIVNNIVIILN